MTALSPARAPAPVGPARSRLPRRRLAPAAIAAAAVIAGLALPARAELATRPASSTATPPPGALSSPVDPPREAASAAARRARHVPAPRPLDPAPPPDQRDAPDPFILADGDRYAMYSTQSGSHSVPVATSPDLREWTPTHDALPQLPAWAAWGRTWAPGVARLGDRYLLYFAARHASSGRQCIGVAAGASATGPFASTASEPLVCQTELGGSIDPHPFVDRDGAAYLLWKADSNAIGRVSTLFAQRLAPDGLALAGEPVGLLTSGAAWEQPLIENPALVATGGSYVLFYSGGWYNTAGYAVGYATCDSPLGPCAKATVAAPLLASAGDEAGPGGASVVTGPAGDQWLAYHAWMPEAVGYDHGGARSLRFASLTWVDGQPAVAR